MITLKRLPHRLRWLVASGPGGLKGGDVTMTIDEAESFASQLSYAIRHGFARRAEKAAMRELLVKINRKLPQVGRMRTRI